MTRPSLSPACLPHACLPRVALLAVVLGSTLLGACDRAAEQPEAAPPPPTPPAALQTPPPDYPAEFACRQKGGQVLLDVSLSNEGVPTRVSIARSSGVPELDQSAMTAVRAWKFRPATVRGVPAPIKLQVPITFTPPNPPPEECNRFL